MGHDEHVVQVRGRLYGPRHDVLAGLGAFALLQPPARAEDPELSV